MKQNKLTFRDLRSNLKEILDRMEAGEVFEIRGMFLKLDMPELSNEALEKAAKRMPNKGAKPPSLLVKDMPLPGQITLQEQIDAIQKEPHEITHVDGPFYDPCGMCNKPNQLYRFHEDGEGYEVCELCLKNKLGKHAKKYINDLNKVVPSEPVRVPRDFGKTANLLIRQTKVERPPVKYCTKCKCQAVSGNSTLCVKCGSKKKRKSVK